MKIIEEPPQKTLFILVAEDIEQLLATIVSRCQIVHFPPLEEELIKNALISKERVSEKEAAKIAHQSNGNWNKALQRIHHRSNDRQFEEWFVHWVRSAFKAKANPAVIRELIAWTEMLAVSGRETQKKFLIYCTQLFRQALLINYGIPQLVYIEPDIKGFSLEKFASFIHSRNINDIVNELEEAAYHIERNANAKVVLLDMSIKLTRLLHQKE